MDDIWFFNNSGRTSKDIFSRFVTLDFRKMTIYGSDDNIGFKDRWLVRFSGAIFSLRLVSLFSLFCPMKVYFEYSFQVFSSKQRNTVNGLFFIFCSTKLQFSPAKCCRKWYRSISLKSNILLKLYFWLTNQHLLSSCN